MSEDNNSNFSWRIFYKNFNHLKDGSSNDFNKKSYDDLDKPQDFNHKPFKGSEDKESDLYLTDDDFSLEDNGGSFESRFHDDSWDSFLDDDSFESSFDNSFNGNFSKDTSFESSFGDSSLEDDSVKTTFPDGDIIKDSLPGDNHLDGKFSSIYSVKNQGFTLKEKTLLNNIRNQLVDLAINNKETKEIARFDDIKDMLKLSLDESTSEEYINDLSRRFYEYINGYGIINPLVNNDDLEEIMVIGSNKPVYVYHRNYGMVKTDIYFNDDEEIIRLIDSIARANHRRFDSESPIFDGKLKDGSRVNGTLPPISADGPTLTIRKFRKDPFTIIDLIKNNTLNSEIAAFLWLCIDGLGVRPSNIIISGGTSSGKTTLLNALAALINPKERIVTIEDTLELQIPHDHIVRMETRLANIEGKGEINMDSLVKNALRQRPDRIIVGEVRGSEAITLFTALNTGHSGFGTLHANSGRETITRLINPPMNVPKIMISAIDFILIEKRIYLPDGVNYRRLTELNEVVGMEEGTIQLNKLFIWNPLNDSFKNMSLSSKTLEKLEDFSGLNYKNLEGEIKRRKLFFDLMAKKNLRSNKILTKMVKMYCIDSDRVLRDLSSI